MERPLTLKPLSIQDENSAINCKKPTIEGKSKSTGPVAKKGGVGLESRKVLNNITNKKSVHPGASSQRKGSQIKKSNVGDEGKKHHSVFDGKALSKKTSSLFEKLNIAEEGFLHDHSQCVQAQKAVAELNFWDIVLPGHDMIVEQAEGKPDTDSKRCLEEWPMLEFLGSCVTQWRWHGEENFLDAAMPGNRMTPPWKEVMKYAIPSWLVITALKYQDKPVGKIKQMTEADSKHFQWLTRANLPAGRLSVSSLISILLPRTLWLLPLVVWTLWANCSARMAALFLDI